MARKRVVLLLRRYPLGSVKAAEALRQSVGLTLADNDVTVILRGPGAWLAMPLNPPIIGGEDIAKHIRTLLQLRQRLLVEEESLARLGINRDNIIAGIQATPWRAIAEEMTSADALIPF